MRAAGRLLRAGEVPSLHLPASVTTSGTISRRKAPKERPFVSASQSSPCIESDDETSCRRDTDTQTEFDVGLLEETLSKLRKDSETLQKDLQLLKGDE